MNISSRLNRLRHSFRLRIFFALTFVIVLVISGTGYFCYVQANRIIENQMQHFALASASQISKRVESFLSQHTFNVNLIRDLFENRLIDMHDDKEILRHFQLFQKDHPEFYNILFGDETGRFLMFPAQAPETHATFDPRVRPWYQGALTSLDTHWTDVYLFASSRKPGMTVSVPIYDAARKLQAVCGIDIDISAFSNFLKTIKVGSQGAAYIFDNSTGRIIAHPALVEQPRGSVHKKLLRTAHQHLMNHNETFGRFHFQGRQFFTAYTPYPGNNWTVGVTLPVSDFFENVSAIRNAVLSLVVGGIFLASLLSYLIAMTIVRPLNRLKSGIDWITRGNLENTVDIHDPDIAAELARSFNQMAAALNKKNLELKKTYHELAQSEKLAAVGQMTAGIAHEIKNPLGIIQGSAQVVANPNRPIEMREKAAQFIMAEVDRLNHTLTTFLDFAKPPSPRMKPLDLALLIEEMLEPLGRQHPDHTFTSRFPQRLEKITGDRDQLHQVFLNLAINAVQAMPDGGLLEISVKDKPLAVSQANPDAKAFLSVHVQDQGCGISPDQLETIFDPFVSFQDAGIGLGLCIVSQIVKAHEGQIKIKTVLGKGTRFTLLFPITPSKEDFV